MLLGRKRVFQQFDDRFRSLAVPGENERTPGIAMRHVVIECPYHVLVGNCVPAFCFFGRNRPRLHRNLTIVRRIEPAIFAEQGMSQAYGTVHPTSLFRVIDVHVVVGLAILILPVPNTSRGNVEHIDLCRRIHWRIEPHRAERIIRFGSQVIPFS